MKGYFEWEKDERTVLTLRLLALWPGSLQNLTRSLSHTHSVSPLHTHYLSPLSLSPSLSFSPVRFWPANSVLKLDCVDLMQIPRGRVPRLMNSYVKSILHHREKVTSSEAHTHTHTPTHIHTPRSMQKVKETGRLWCVMVGVPSRCVSRYSDSVSASGLIADEPGCHYNKNAERGTH